MFFAAKRHIATLWAREQERFVLWLPVLLALGIGLFFALPYEPSLALSGSIFAALGVASWLLRGHPIARLPVLALALIALGFAAGALRSFEVSAPILRVNIFYKQVEGVVEDVQDRAKGGQRLILRNPVIETLAPEDTPYKISVSTREMTDIQIGDRIRTQAMLFPPPGPVIPGGYDFARQFYFDRIGATGFSPRSPEVTQRAPASYFTAKLNELRLSISKRIAAPMPLENGPVASALMVGEMSAVDPAISDAMRDAGIYHVLSISGLHMSLAAALVFISVRFLLSLLPAFAMRLPTKKIAAAVGMLSAFAYLLLAGYPVPAIRSFVMVACVMLAILCDRRGISLYSLAWSAALILLFQPEALLGASFQLSYSATIAIVAFYEYFGHKLHGDGIIRRLHAAFWGLVLTSLVATLATTPLVIYHFNRFTFWGIAANTLMMPLASFWLMPAAVLSFIAMPFGLEYWPLLWLSEGITLMVRGAEWVAAQPYASVALPPLSFPGMLLTVAGGLWLCLWRTRWRLAGLPMILAGLLTVLLYKPYDILISDDAAKVAMRLSGDDMVFIKGRPASFEGEAWTRASGQKESYGMKDMDEVYEDIPECTKLRCDVYFKDLHIVVARKKKERDGMCEKTDGRAPDIVIGPDYMDRIPACKEVALLIDRAYLQDAGTVAIRIENGKPIVRTTSEYRGMRMWNSVYQSPNPAMMNGEPPNGVDKPREP